MSLPPPPYTRTGLDAYLEATGVYCPLPPGPPEDWSCLVSGLGTPVLVARDDGMTEIVDRRLFEALLSALGRPTRAEEQLAFLLVSPVPGDTDWIGAFLGLLDHPSYWVRRRAALCLAELDIGERRDEVCDALKGVLSDGDSDARRGATEALGKLGTAEHLSAVLPTTWDDHNGVNAARVRAVLRLGLDDQETVARRVAATPEHPLRHLLDDILSAEAGDLGPLVARLEEADEVSTKEIAFYLASRPAKAARASEILVEKIDGMLDDATCWTLTRALGAAGEDGMEQVGPLLSHTGWRQRMWGAAAVACAGPVRAEVLEAVRGLLDDDDSDVQREAALALIAHGVRDAHVTSLLPMVARRENLALHRAAALGIDEPELALINVVAGGAAPGLELVGMMGGYTEADLRGLALIALALFHPEPLAPYLESIARDDARQLPSVLRRMAAAALFLTGRPPTWLGAVHRVLLCHQGDASSMPGGGLNHLRASELATLIATDSDWPVRMDALRLLKQLGPQAAPYADIVKWSSRHDPDGDVRQIASEMGANGWTERSVGDELAVALVPPRGSTSDEQRAAALHRIADQDPSLAEVLAGQLLDADNRALARASARILGRLAAHDRGPELAARGVARLEHPSWVVREAACDLLGALRGLPEGLVEEVVEALRVRIRDDGDGDVKRAATAALYRLAPDRVGQGEA